MPTTTFMRLEPLQESRMLIACIGLGQWSSKVWTHFVPHFARSYSAVPELRGGGQPFRAVEQGGIAGLCK